MSPGETTAIGPGLCRAAYRGVMLVYGIVFCGGYIPIMLFFMPTEPFMVGQARALVRCTSLVPTGQWRSTSRGEICPSQMAEIAVRQLQQNLLVLTKCA